MLKKRNPPIARASIAALCIFCFGVATAKQAANSSGSQSKQAAASAIAASDDPASARYVYEFNQPDFNERRILIEHDATGRGTVTFERKNSSDPTVEKFELSPVSLKRITDLWKELRFLESETNYQAEKQFPHLGTMRLKVVRDGRERTAEFNWTNDRSASALVNEYRRVADQILFVFDMNVARQNQPLETPKILKRLDLLLNRNALSDPAQLAPLLSDLNTDERLPLIARNHAERLLKKIEKLSRSEGK